MFIKHQLHAAEQHLQLPQAELHLQLILEQHIQQQLTTAHQQLTRAVEQKAMVQHAPLTMNAAQTFVQEEFVLQQLRDIRVQLTLAELIHRQPISLTNVLQDIRGIAIMKMIVKISAARTGAHQCLEALGVVKVQPAQLKQQEQRMLRRQPTKPASRKLFPQ